MPPGASPATISSRPAPAALDVGHHDEHALAAAEEVAGHAREPLATAVDRLRSGAGRHGVRLARAGQTLPERPLLA